MRTLFFDAGFLVVNGAQRCSCEMHGSEINYKFTSSTYCSEYAPAASSSAAGTCWYWTFRQQYRYAVPVTVRAVPPLMSAMLPRILTCSSLILFYSLALHHLCVLLPGWQACCTADAWHVGIGHHPSASHFLRRTFGGSIVANTKPLAVKYGAQISKNGYDSLNLNSRRKSPYLNLQTGNDEAQMEEVADDLYTPDVTGGRVKNLSRHVDFLDKS